MSQPEAASQGQRKVGIVRIDMRWSQVVGIVAFVALVGPGLVYIGKLSERVNKLDGIPERVLVVETRQDSQYKEILRRLEKIEASVNGGVGQ